MSYSNQILQRLSEYYSNEANRFLVEKSKRKTFFDIINKSRKEEVHTNFLKWIFDLKNLPCSDEFYPIQQLVSIIIERAISQSKKDYIDGEILHSMLTGSMNVRVTEITTEKMCPGVEFQSGSEKNEGKIDLIINCDAETKSADGKVVSKFPLKIFVENKVESFQHDLQTWKYYTYFTNGTSYDSYPDDIKEKIKIKDKSKYKGEPGEKQLFVFLAPGTDENLQQADCHYFVNICYQDIMDKILDPMSKWERLGAREKIFIREYMDTLSIPNTENNYKIPIMALSKEDYKILSDFFDNNFDLIDMAVKALAEYSPDDETRQSAKNMLQSMSKIHDSRSSNNYDLIINGTPVLKCKKMSEVSKRVIVYLIERGTSLSDINKLFDTKHIVSKSLGGEPVMLTSNMHRNHDKARGQICMINGKEYWIIKEWNSTRGEAFKENVNEKYPVLQII